jgi:hypothetical protein
MMLYKKVTALSILLFGFLLLNGCQENSRDQVLLTKESQLDIRSIQTRAFDTLDREATLRSVMSTLQDLSFVIEKADFVLGSVTGTKFFKDGAVHVPIKMTVIVRKRNKNQVLVRANAQYGISAIEEAAPYLDFFTNLEKSLFLTAHKVD